MGGIKRESIVYVPESDRILSLNLPVAPLSRVPLSKASNCKRPGTPGQRLEVGGEMERETPPASHSAPSRVCICNPCKCLVSDKRDAQNRRERGFVLSHRQSCSFFSFV